MAFPDAGCGWEIWGFSSKSQKLVVAGTVKGSHGSPRRWLWPGEMGVLMAVPDAGCWSWKGCGGEMWGFSWQSQSQSLVVAWRFEGSHGSPTSFLYWERRGFSWESQTLIVGQGRQGFSWQSQMVGCVGERWCSNGSFTHWLWGEEVVLMAISDAGSGGERWGFSWQSQMLDVGAGIGGGSHGSPNRWLWG